MSSKAFLGRLAGSLSVLGVFVAVGPVGAALAADDAGQSSTRSEEIVIDSEGRGGPVTVAGLPAGGIYDAGPTPVDAGDPSPAPDHVDPELPIDPAEPDTDPQGTASTGSHGDDRSTLSSEPSTGARAGRGADASVREIPLARTGFPALALGSAGFLSLLTGLFLLGLRRV